MRPRLRTLAALGAIAAAGCACLMLVPIAPAADAPGLVPLQVEHPTLNAASLMLNRAIDQLKAESTYAWTSSVSFTSPVPDAPGKPKPNFVYPAARGVTESSGLTQFSESPAAAGDPADFVVQGQAVIVKSQDDWKPADPKIAAIHAHYGSLPADAALMVRNVLDLKKNDDGTFSGELTERAAGDLLLTGRVQPPKLLLDGETANLGLDDVLTRFGIPKASARFTTKDGILVKVEVNLRFIKSGDENPPAAWIQTIDFTDLGTATLNVSDDAKALLATIVPAASAAPTASAAPADPGAAAPGMDTSRFTRTRGTRGDRTGASAFAASSYDRNPNSEQPIALLPDYEVLAHKSIFEKDRRPYIPVKERPVDDTPHGPVGPLTPTPPKVPTLVGVLIGDTDYVAYIEDPNFGKLWPVGVGDPLPMDFGQVTKVTLNSIEIAKPGTAPREILIGQNLKGETPPPPPIAIPSSPSSSSSTAAAPAATLPAVDINDPEAMSKLSVADRMKLRRAQQTGGQ